jgi:hypothetical protein
MTARSARQNRGVSGSGPYSEFPYRIGAAYRRAVTYVAVCWVVSAATGTLGRILSEPIATADQLDDPSWWAWTIGSAAVIVVCYTIIWTRWTLTFDRPLRLVPQVLFGLVWASGTGQLLASVYVTVDRTGWPRWGVWLVSFAVISAWQGAWQDLYWDVRVSPEHDTPQSIRRKVVASHVPNVVVTLTYLVIHGNLAIYVMLQGLALASASVGMRFPAPWETRPIKGATVGPGPFGIPRCVGYLTDDPNPYRTQREARRAGLLSTTGAGP